MTLAAPCAWTSPFTKRVTLFFCTIWFKTIKIVTGFGSYIHMICGVSCFGNYEKGRWRQMLNEIKMIIIWKKLLTSCRSSHYQTWYNKNNHHSPRHFEIEWIRKMLILFDRLPLHMFNGECLHIYRTTF